VVERGIPMKPQDLETAWLDAQYMHEFVGEHLRDKCDETRKRYERVLRRFIEFCCARWACAPEDLDFSACTEVVIEDNSFYEQIGRDVVEEFLKELPTPRAREYASIVLRSYFRYLLDLGVVQMIPVPKPAKLALKQQETGLSENETYRLAMALLGSSNPYRFALIVQLSAGLRVGEVCALRVNDVERTPDGNWEVSIRREVQKGKRARRVPLPDVSLVMQEWMDWRRMHHISSEYLFVGRDGKPLTLERLNRFMKRIAKTAQLPALTTHDLRRAYATIMDKYIVNPDALSQALGHAPGTWTGNIVTRGYVRRPELEEVKFWLGQLAVIHLAESLALKWAGLRKTGRTCKNKET
jgi:integrase